MTVHLSKTNGKTKDFFFVVVVRVEDEKNLYLSDMAHQKASKWVFMINWSLFCCRRRRSNANVISLNEPIMTRSRKINTQRIPKLKYWKAATFAFCNSQFYTDQTMREQLNVKYADEAEA